jgi:hypothetical protein
MKHWKAYIKQQKPNGTVAQYIDTIVAPNQFEAENAFKKKHGNNCILGWIKETKLYGIQSISN